MKVKMNKKSDVTIINLHFLEICLLEFCHKSKETTAIVEVLKAFHKVAHEKVNFNELTNKSYLKSIHIVNKLN